MTALATPLDHTNPYHLEEIRHRYAQWLLTNGGESFDRNRIVNADGWRLLGRNRMRQLPLADQADWLAATEYDAVAAARPFHCDRATTLKLIRKAQDRQHGHFTRTMLPVPTGLVMFSAPVGRAPVSEVFEEHMILDVIALYWDHDPDVDPNLVRVTACFDARGWRQHVYQQMILRGSSPDEAVEVLDVESSPELSYAMELEIILADTDAPVPWEHTYLRPPGIASDDEKETNLRSWLPRRTWLPVIHELWDMMTSPDLATSAPVRVPPGKASARRLAAAGAFAVRDAEQMVELVYWRKPKPPAPPAPVAPAAPPEPTGRTWTLTHEVPVRPTMRKIRDADGNVIKEVPVKGHVRGKGLGPKRTTTLVRDNRKDPTTP